RIFAGDGEGAEQDDDELDSDHRLNDCMRGWRGTVEPVPAAGQGGCSEQSRTEQGREHEDRDDPPRRADAEELRPFEGDGPDPGAADPIRCALMPVRGVICDCGAHDGSSRESDCGCSPAGIVIDSDPPARYSVAASVSDV